MKSNRTTLTLLLCALCAIAAVPANAMSEGADLEFGGTGAGNGKFYDTRDIKFDSKGVMYVLDGGEYKTGQRQGNFLVQKFDQTGAFLGQFSVYEDSYGPKNDPQRMAVDSKGDVYITEPKADEVWEFGPTGQPVRALSVPGVAAVTSWTVAGQERIAAIGYRLDKAAFRGHAYDQVYWAPADGALQAPIALPFDVFETRYMTSDASGNLYVAGGKNQIFKFAPEGKLVTSLGAQTMTRSEDGSELMWDVALDSKGNIYSWTWGNPGKLVKIDPDFKTETMREGQFHWADAWSDGSYVPIAFDPSDRAWVAVTGYVNPNGPNAKRYHFRPAILRLASNFFDPGQNGVAVKSTFTIGIKPVVTTTIPYDITYSLDPVSMNFAMQAANRKVDSVHVDYHIYDAYHVSAGAGQFDMNLRDGVEADQAVQFTPPKLGWYTAEFTVSHDGVPLATAGHHFGVTRSYAGLPELAAGSSQGGWVDPIRQAFAGLPLLRLHPSASNPTSLDDIDTALTESAKYGVTTFLQFSSKPDCDPDFVKQVVTRFKGRVKVYELMNEPNFSMEPDAYVAMAKVVSPIIKSIDPAAQVMGPDVCGIQLGWYDAFYKTGGGPLFDILSVHDYEGNESIDPYHWNWKYGELRKLMAANGDGAKAVWQTERAITGLRGQDLLPIMQAVRVTLHQDLLDNLGIPNEHDYLYYLNQGGYSAVPSYVWSNDGPFAAALATRTRQAMISGRRFSGALDFGPNGQDLFLGLRFIGDDGQTIIVRNLGLADRPIPFGVSGGDTIEVVDAFGNAQLVSMQNGSLVLTIGQMPTYIRLKPGQSIAPPVINYGPNLAPDATFAYSAPASDPAKPLNIAALNDGVMQSIHPNDPAGVPFIGDLPSLPQNLDITFKQPRSIGKVLLFSSRADNVWCALLDYDVQAWINGAWTTVDQERTPFAASEPDKLGASEYIGWIQDTNISLAKFGPVTTDKLRIVVKRTTHGFQPDPGAAAPGKLIPQKLMLREVQVFGP